MSKPDQTELLPCPFCNGAAHFGHDDNGWNWIECGQCHTSTKAAVHAGDDCRQMLAEAWNRRAVPALVQPEPSDGPITPEMMTQAATRAGFDPVPGRLIILGGVLNAMLAASPSTSLTPPAPEAKLDWCQHCGEG